MRDLNGFFSHRKLASSRRLIALQNQNPERDREESENQAVVLVFQLLVKSLGDS